MTMACASRPIETSRFHSQIKYEWSLKSMRNECDYSTVCFNKKGVVYDDETFFFLFIIFFSINFSGDLMRIGRICIAAKFADILKFFFYVIIFDRLNFSSSTNMSEFSFLNETFFCIQFIILHQSIIVHLSNTKKRKRKK